MPPASEEALPPAGPLRIEVDLTDAPRQILHARLALPVRPGALALVHPRWIPGEHGPTGPITDVVGLTLTAAGQTLPWRRDPLDLHVVHVDIPANATTLEASLDFLVSSQSGGFTAGSSTTPRLAMLNWNQVLLYPRGARAADLSCEPRLRLPRGWKHATALDRRPGAGEVVEFRPVSLETLVDSPVLAGQHLRSIELNPGGSPAFFLHMAADSPEALEMPAEWLASYRRLVAEAMALFGVAHFDSYHFLYVLSDTVSHFGLEHHASSDNRVKERTLLDPDLRRDSAGLLPHELAHSWNGKHRRPVELTTPDFEQPFQTGMLWVYEGLTSYLGTVLAARSGLRPFEETVEDLGLTLGQLDSRPGRTWRPLADTAAAASLLFRARREGASLRRGVDFYSEGVLIWLETDIAIRRLTEGKRSLDDFCALFFGPPGGRVSVRPYTLDDIVSTLNSVARFNWKAFLAMRVEALTPHPPMAWVQDAGWILSWKPERPALLKAQETADKTRDFTWSCGFTLATEDSRLIDVVAGSPAARAGLVGGMQLLAVGGRAFTPERLQAALRAAQDDTAAIEILARQGDFFSTHRLEAHEGERFPVLVRDPSRPDLLAAILAPLRPPSGSAGGSRPASGSGR